MNLLVVGCGRVGAELSYRLFKSGHQVVVVDSNREAFNRLPPEFRGRTLEGEGLAENVLERAGIRDADGAGDLRCPDRCRAQLRSGLAAGHRSIRTANRELNLLGCAARRGVADEPG